MKPMVKGKLETSSKVKKIKILSVKRIGIINRNYHKKQIFGYHDALKIYGALNLCTDM